MQNFRFKKISTLLLCSMLMVIIGCDAGGDMENKDLLFNSLPPSGAVCGEDVAMLGVPLRVMRETGKPLEKISSFISGNFDICLFVERTGEKAPGAAVISIDGNPVAFTSDFSANFESLVRRIPLSEVGPGKHELSVKLMGKPCEEDLTSNSDEIGNGGGHGEKDADKGKKDADHDVKGDDNEHGADKMAFASCGGLDVYIKPSITVHDDDGLSREEWLASQEMERLIHEEERTLEFRILLEEWTTPENLYQLMQDSGGAEVTKLRVKVQKGENFLYSTIDLAGTSDLSNMMPIIQEKYDWCLETSFSCEENYAWILEDGVNAGHLLIGYPSVSSTPSTMLDFWQKHPESIRLIQTISKGIDNSQTPYYPHEEVD